MSVVLGRSSVAAIVRASVRAALLAVVLAVVVPLAGCATADPDALPVEAITLVRADGSEVAATVRVAATPDARSRGLMGVTDLPPGTGMLFLFPGVADHGGFWMKDTPIPLDIAFLRQGEIVAVATMPPCAADPCPVFRPGVPYDAALEVPAGWFAAEAVGPGSGLRRAAAEATAGQ